MSETGSTAGPATPEDLYRAFMAPRPADESEMAYGLRLVGLAHVIMENLDDVLAYVKTRPDLRRAAFYHKLDAELNEMDDTTVARAMVTCDWLGLNFLNRSDLYAHFNNLAELLASHEEMWEFAGRPEDHFSTAETFLP